MCYFNTINLSNLCPNGFRALKFIYLAFSRAHTRRTSHTKYNGGMEFFSDRLSGTDISPLPG